MWGRAVECGLVVADSAWRLGNNLLGAAITLLAATFLWPHHTQRRPARPRCE
ncbi:hypothetical protein [Streptomyces sp. NPDC001404]|uniref:hypothetical protein n=1 Tax=Streptomyces sp. NPDC001404 TaxID=3364571 RepID=UPI0036B2E39A